MCDYHTGNVLNIHIKGIMLCILKLIIWVIFVKLFKCGFPLIQLLYVLAVHAKTHCIVLQREFITERHN